LLVGIKTPANDCPGFGDYDVLTLERSCACSRSSTEYSDSPAD
jgi:hypothetical protein